jgi:hypothetical protein
MLKGRYGIGWMIVGWLALGALLLFGIWTAFMLGGGSALW